MLHIQDFLKRYRKLIKLVLSLLFSSYSFPKCWERYQHDRCQLPGQVGVASHAAHASGQVEAGTIA